MEKTITQLQSVTAEQIITQDLMNAFIAEQFFYIDKHTTKMLSDVPNVIQGLSQAFVGGIYFHLKRVSGF
ncbi:hypothetical protein, partial [Bacillus sp. V33-4]|uniref:hypothetical protein n=1 Tax=Bacillus sp. V33-4 TaxID=2054169 RepID=UPI000CAC1694